MLNELEVEEWASLSDLLIESDVDTIILSNTAGEGVDEDRLAQQFESIEGIQQIKSLIVQPESKVRHLSFIIALPSLENLQLYGYELESLRGIDRFPRGKYIKIDTGKNRRRTLDQLAECRILRFSVRWGNVGDIKAIGRNSTILDLELRNWPTLSLNELKSVPLENITLVRAQFEEFGRSHLLHRLDRLAFVDCRKLRSFTGDNSNVRWLTIETCNQLDLSTVSTFKGLETLEISTIRGGISLSNFLPLSNLRCVSIENCKVKLDADELKSDIHGLEEIWISELRKSALTELSRKNRDVLVSNGVHAFKNSQPVEVP